MGEPMLDRVREAAGAPHQLEYSELAELLSWCRKEIEFLRSVAGPVSRSTAYSAALGQTARKPGDEAI